MKFRNSFIPLKFIVHNDLDCYVKSNYGGKGIKKWPFYKFIRLFIDGNHKRSRNLWINWLIQEFDKYCFEVKSKGGMFQGSVHKYSINYLVKNKEKKDCWLNPKLLSRANIKKGATFLVDKRIKMINSIVKNGYKTNFKDPIVAVKKKNLYVLKGGHHRASVLYVIGKNQLPAVIVYPGFIWNFKKWLKKIKKFLN